MGKTCSNSVLTWWLTLKVTYYCTMFAIITAHVDFDGMVFMITLLIALITVRVAMILHMLDS